MIAKSVFKLSVFIMPLMLVFGADAAVVARKQSVIQSGTNVRARTTATGVYDQDCYDAYYGCMVVLVCAVI